MRAKRTNRGFDVIPFLDEYNIPCSLQKSSLAGPQCIWFGCDNADPKVLVPGKSWQPVPMPDGYMAHTRMHLSQAMVKRLLPHLIHFAETGEIRIPPKTKEAKQP